VSEDELFDITDYYDEEGDRLRIGTEKVL